MGLLLLSYGPPWVRLFLEASNFTRPAAILMTLAATATAVVIHEMGHLLAAVALDFEVLGISLGPLRVQWLHGKYAWRFSARRLFSGSVAALPKNIHDWRKRSMWVVAAGPAATLVTGIAAGCAVIFQPAGSPPPAFCAALAQLSFFISVLGLIPNGAKAASRNDASLFWTLFYNGPEAGELEVVYLIGQLKLHAIRPADYPRPLLDRLAISRFRRSATKVLAARTIADWALDLGDMRTADLWDREALAQAAHCHPRLRNSALAASACFDVLFREDARSARAKLEKVDLDELFPLCFAHRVRAARLLAMGLAQRAPAEIIRAQYALPMGLSYYDFERMLLEKAHLQALAQAPLEQPQVRPEFFAVQL